MYRDYLIMQEAGHRASRSYPDTYMRRPRRVAVVSGDGPVEALAEFKFRKYLSTFNRQYVASKMQWRTRRNLRSNWRDWNGTDDPGTRGREWRLVVTLRNGRVEHDAYFQAWRKDE